jgi:hypothetical protein
MTIEEFERLQNSVAAEMSAPGFFPVTMPENELHPDPARLQAEIVSLRYRVEALERKLGMPSNVRTIRTG